MVGEQKAMPPIDLEGGTTPELVVPSLKMVGVRKGFIGGSMLQDLVVRASSGVLQFPDLYGSIGNSSSSCTVGTSGDILGDTHTQPTNMVDQDNPCALHSSCTANTDYGDGGFAENIKGSVEVPCSETDTDMDIEVVPGEGIQDMSDFNGEEDLKILPKWKRLPKGAPDSCQTRLMSPIERALRNAPSRKTKYIFESSLGTKFNCITEAQEFYNIYSWEVGFGTRKGDKRKERMQEFHCICKGTDNCVQYKTMKKNCPAMVRLRRTEDFGWYVSENRADHNHPLSESCAEKLCWNSHGNIDLYTKDMIRYLRDNNVTLTKVNHIMGSLIGPTGEAP